MRTAPLLLLPLLALAIAGPATAQPAAAQAELLFREGKRLMGDGNFAAACEAFEGSQRKAPSPATLLNLGDCREKNQEYASAWAHFVEAARISRSDPSLAGLYESAQTRATAAEQRMSYLIINVPDEARVDGLTITKNGSAIDAAEWNRDIPVDGGTYEIIGKAPAFEAWSTKVTVANAKDKQSVNVPRFREAIATTTAPTREEHTLSFTGKRKVALALWVVGAAGLGTGVVFELRSGSTYDDAKASPDNAQRHELTDQANRQRRVGVAAVSAGAVVVGVGVYLWLSGKPERSQQTVLAPELGPDRAGLVLLGRF